MNVLAIDAAGPEPGVALLAGGEIFEETLPGDRQASERLLSAIARCLEKAGIPLEACGRIAVSAGPGSCTGLRVGLATAWGLGRAREIPVEAVSTLEGLADAARGNGIPQVAAALDAGRGEVVLERFSLAGPRAVSLAGPLRVSRDAAREPSRHIRLPRPRASRRGGSAPGRLGGRRHTAGHLLAAERGGGETWRFVSPASRRIS